MSKHNGGPAYPHNRSLALCERCAEEHSHGGLSWLDYAAIQVVAAVVSNKSMAQAVFDRTEGAGHTSFEHGVAEAAYGHAEALLAEKRRRESEGE